MAGRVVNFLAGYPHDGGKQAQRVWAATIFEAPRFHLPGQGFGVTGNGFGGAQQGFSGEGQLQVLGYLMPVGRHCRGSSRAGPSWRGGTAIIACVAGVEG